MAVTHTFKYCRNTQNGIEERVETRELTAKAAIKFHCLDCSGGLSKEVRECEIGNCALWPFRPYQQK